MSKYYYVNVTNSCPDGLDNLILNREISGSYSPTCSCLKDVKKIVYMADEYGFFGPTKIKKTIYGAVPIIGEEYNGQYLRDLINGEYYIIIKQDYHHPNRSQNISVEPVMEMPKNVVADILRNLTNEDIARYKQNIEKLKEHLNNQLKVYENLVRQHRIQNDEDDKLIENFKRKHDK